MCIIDTTESTNIGNIKKPKKLNLSVSKNNFLNRMIFSSNEEKEDCIKYLDLKGISYHTVLVNYIGFDENGKVEYKKVADLYRYDKRIRNILYRFLSAFEEGIRAFISNRYSNNLNQIKSGKKLEEIKKNISEGSSLSKELENLLFKELLDLSKELSLEVKKELYGKNIKHLRKNLNAIRELRNVVSHHRILCVYDDFEECFLDDKKGDNLIDNIKNLYNLLNPYYKEFFKEQINNSCLDEDEPNFKNLLPEKAILVI